MNEAFLFDDVTLWAVIVGFIAPTVVAFVARPAMSATMKISIQVVFSVIVAGVTCYLNGVLEGRSFISVLLVVLAASTLAYKGFWKPTGAADAIESGVNAGQVDNALPPADEVNPQDIR